MNLAILYTANLRGDLEQLPRLYTFIRSLQKDMARFRPEPEDEADVLLCPVQPPPLRTLLLDLGESCAPEIWHCAATGGRSTLIALDAMGYHAANVTDLLTAEGRAKLDGNVMGMALVDPDHPWQDADGLVAVVSDSANQENGAAHPAALRIRLAPADATRLAGNTLTLRRVEAGQVGTAYIGGADTSPLLLADAVFDLPPSTPPDPTIAGTIDFIIREAQLYARKGQG